MFEIFDGIFKRKAEIPYFVELQESNVTPRIPKTHIRPHTDYFSVVVDGFFIPNSRILHREVDPIVLAVTEFSYGTERSLVLPFVIGPQLLGKTATQLPQGMLYRGTKVAGFHPFRGGSVAISLILCHVERHNYLQRMLGLVESLASSFSFETDLKNYCNLARTWIDSIGEVLGSEGTTPLIGIRQEFNHDVGNPIRAGTFLLSDASEGEMIAQHLFATDGRLLIGGGVGRKQPANKWNYILFSVHKAEIFSNVNALSVQDSVQEVLKLSAGRSNQEWERTVSELAVLLRRLVACPDLTRQQAMAYYEEVVKEAMDTHKKVLATNALGSVQPSRAASEEFERYRALFGAIKSGN
jgi:hypothetical protein